MLDNLLDIYTSDVKFAEDPIINFQIGYEYEKNNQTSSAISFYLRSAERTFNIDLQYEALLRMSICFDKQTRRHFTVKGQLQKAISLIPDRPEGYFLLAKHYLYNETNDNKWYDCNMICSIGMKFINNASNSMLTDIGFSVSEFLFLYGISNWWIGNCEFAKETLYDILLNHNLENNIELKNRIKNDLDQMGGIPNRFQIKKHHEQHSQVGQDIFVLEQTNFKNKGYYLEIGSNDPIVNNNTFLLESKYNWKGISVDIDNEMVKKFNYYRNNSCFCSNALNIDYNQLLDSMQFPIIVDYLSIDCEPSETSFEILKTILNSKYYFKIITFEHDYYANNNTIKEESRKLLLNIGYNLVVSDVCCDIENTKPFEDWFVANF